MDQRELDLRLAASRMCDAVHAHSQFLKSLGIDVEDVELEAACEELLETLNGTRYVPKDGSLFNEKVRQILEETRRDADAAEGFLNKLARRLRGLV